ncbi:MAG: ABC transporter transmembrane domain-containing protein, partial [Actinomycetota bacterium]
MPRHHGLTPPSKPDTPARPGTFRRIVAIFQPYRRKVSFVAILILITSVLGLINPLLIKVFFDDVVTPILRGETEGKGQLLAVIAISMILSPIIAGALGLWQTYTNNVVGQNVMQDLRNALYSHLQHMPLKFFTSTRTGEIQS